MMSKAKLSLSTDSLTSKSDDDETKYIKEKHITNLDQPTSVECFVDTKESFVSGAVARILVKEKCNYSESSNQDSEDIDVTRLMSSFSVTDECHLDEDSSYDYKQNKSIHVFVLSKAGKPIYSRFGDENILSSIMGVMQALVSFVAASGDELRVINAVDKKIIFIIRSHLILVAVGQMCEPSVQLFNCLKYVYNQIISSLTLQRLEKQFEKYNNLDLRRLLVGDSRLLSSVIDQVESSFGVMLDAINCTPVSDNVRSTISQIINQNVKSRGLVFALLISHDSIACIVRMRNQQLCPLDIHLLLNLICSSQSFKSAQSHWLPICLPQFDSNGFLYANISYLDDTTCLVLLTVDSSQFDPLQSVAEEIVNDLKSVKNQGYLTALKSAKSPSVSETGISSLRHFVYKSVPLAQYVASQWTVPYLTNSRYHASEFHQTMNNDDPVNCEQFDFQQLVHLAYRRLYNHIHFSSIGIKFTYQVTSTALYFAWKSEAFELYATVEPFIGKNELNEIREELVKWIDNKRTQFFITTSPTF